MTELTGKQILELLKNESERKCFNFWERPIDSYPYFLRNVWLKLTWTQWFNVGFIEGAATLRAILNAQESNSAEYQCLQHHFCIES